MLFWTFAPYLFKHLISIGESDSKAIKKILLWSTYGLSSTDLSRYRIYDEGTRYRGLEPFNEHGIDQYILAKDSNHVSHRFTDQEASRIVKSGVLDDLEKFDKSILKS